MERRAIAVRGIVQGVGFRPFVYGLASRLKLHGFVRNQTSGVLIEVEGEAGSLDRFLTDHGVSWQTDTEVAGEHLCEVAGRLCFDEATLFVRFRVGEDPGGPRCDRPPQLQSADAWPQLSRC